MCVYVCVCLGRGGALVESIHFNWRVVGSNPALAPNRGPCEIQGPAPSCQVPAPKYLCELMSKPLSAHSSRPQRSTDRCDLLAPWSRTSLSQNRAFAVVGPALWNDTPPALRNVCYRNFTRIPTQFEDVSLHLPVTLYSASE